MLLMLTMAARFAIAPDNNLGTLLGGPQEDGVSDADDYPAGFWAGK